MTITRPPSAPDAASPQRGRSASAPADAGLAALIQRTAGGDRAAFRELYIRTSPKLLGLVIRILRSRSEAEDVLQEVYLKVWANAGGFSPEQGSAMGWIGSIARNRAIDVVRARGSAPAEAQETDWFEKLRAPSDVESEMIARDSLAHCLGQLEPQARDMILLAYYEGWSREELATRFDVPVNTVKTWLRRGALTLRDCLDGRE